MKFAVLSLAACAALAFSVGTASAQPRGYHHGNYGYHHHHGYYNGGYYNGGHYRPHYGYPSYGYGYNSGFGLSIVRPGFSLNLGNGAVPYYGSGYGGLYSPYRYGGWGW